MEQDRMLNAALKYARLGWHVMPLRVKGDIKAPHGMLGAGGDGGFHKATTDEATIRAWWARYPEAGIGLNLQASGLIAVDMDPRNNGVANLAELEARFGKLETPIVSETGGDGLHHLYKAPAGVQPPGKVQHKLGVDLVYRGYIVLPPSPHCTKLVHPDGTITYPRSTKRYKWRTGGDPWKHEPPEVPAWVVDRGGAVAKQVNGHKLNGSHALTGTVLPPGGGEVDVFAEDTNPVGLSIEQIRDILEDVPNADETADYFVWLDIQFAIWHETNGSEEGREAAWEWSSRNPKNTEEKFNKTWNSSNIKGKGRAPVTFRYCMKLAKECRLQKIAEAVKQIKLDLADARTLEHVNPILARIKELAVPELDRLVLTQQLQTLYKNVPGFPKLSRREAGKLIKFESSEIAVAPGWAEGVVYLQAAGMFWVPNVGEIPKVSFNDSFAIKLLTRKDRLEGNVVPEFTPADICLNRFSVPRVVRRMYLPGEPEFFVHEGAQYLNSYDASSQPEVPEVLTEQDRENVARVEAHFIHLIPDDREREQITSWLAYIVQTLKRPTWAIVIQGPEEDGKSFIIELMTTILSRKNVTVVSPSAIEHPFTGWAEGGLLKCIDELKLHGHNRHEVLNRLKMVITNSVIEVHRKGVDPYNVPNTAGYLITTNFRDAVPVGGDDSRYYMISSPRQTREAVLEFKAANPGYFDRLFGALKESPGALRGWLLAYPISPDFKPNGRAPWSREHDYAATLAKSPEQTAIEEALASGNPLIGDLLLDTQALAEALTDAGITIPHTQSWNRLLTKMGFTYLGRIKIKGDKRRFWTKSPAWYARDADLAGQIRAVIRLLGEAEDL